MVLQLKVLAFMFLQESAGGAIGFDPRAMWTQMGWLARLVVILLFVMSAWSIGGFPVSRLWSVAPRL